MSDVQLPEKPIPDHINFPPTKDAAFKQKEVYAALTRKYFPILAQLEEVQIFRTCKADILSAAQKLVLKYALSPAKLEKASFISLCQGFEILNKVERLESNKSTENINTIGKLKVEHALASSETETGNLPLEE